MKKSIKTVSLLLAFLLLCGTLPVFAQEEVRVTLHEVGAVSVHTERQTAYLENEDIWSVYDPEGINARGIEELSRQNPVLLGWDVEGEYTGAFDVRVYRDEALTDEVHYTTPERYADQAIVEEGGKLYFTAGGEKVTVAQLQYHEGYYYYTNKDGSLVRNANKTVKEGYGDIPRAQYHFNELGRMDNGPIGLYERAVCNLMPGTYYWTVSYTVGEETVTTEASTFSVLCEAPFNYTVNGVTNVRDLGYLKTEDGGMTRPGLLIRGGELNECYDVVPCITPDGIDAMRNQLGIRAELDLRSDNEVKITQSPLGEDVRYYHYNIPYFNYGDVKELQPVFSLLADEENYPLYCHCKVGTDRTGFVFILVEALLGVSYDDIVREYLFSNYGNIGDFRDNTSIDASALPAIAAYSNGTTLAQKAYNFCHEQIGVPTEQLDAVIGLLKVSPQDVCEGVPALGIEARGHEYQNGTCIHCGAADAAPLKGDVNLDGAVDGKDCILIAQYVAEWDVEIDQTLADLNGDERVNGKDAILCAQLCAEA